MLRLMEEEERWGLDGVYVCVCEGGDGGGGVLGLGGEGFRPPFISPSRLQRRHRRCSDSISTS